MTNTTKAQGNTVLPTKEVTAMTQVNLPMELKKDFTEAMVDFKDEINKEEGHRQDLTAIYKRRGEDASGLPQAWYHSDPATPALLEAMFDDMGEIKDIEGYQVRSALRRFCLVMIKAGLHGNEFMTVGKMQSRTFDFLYGYAARAGEELGLTSDLKATGRAVRD